jgi:hypothetical protein
LLSKLFSKKEKQEIIEIRIDLLGEMFKRQPVLIDKNIFQDYMVSYISRFSNFGLKRFYFSQMNGRELFEHAAYADTNGAVEKSIIELNPQLNLKELKFYTWASMDAALFDTFRKEMLYMIKRELQAEFEAEKSQYKIHSLNGKDVRFLKKDNTTFVIPNDLFKKLTFEDYYNLDDFAKINNLEEI